MHFPLSTLTRFVRPALERIGAGVRSLSARSFKVRHGLRKDKNDEMARHIPRWHMLATVCHGADYQRVE